MRKSSTTVLVVFVVALVYGSACAASCAVGQCINLFHSESFSRHHESSEHCGAPSDDEHSPSNCNTHGHPESFVKGPAAPQFAPSATIWFAASHAAALPDLPVLGVNIVSRRGHGPPETSSEPLYEKISILRI